MQKNPLSDRAYVPKVTCADPFCPDFNLPLRPDEHRFSIEPFDNYRIPIVPNHPLADLATVRASPINGEANLRGKGKRGCLWMHVACAESLGIGQLNQVDCVRTEDRPSVHLQFDYRLESPDKYAILKWVAVDKGAIGLLGSDGEIWRKDDGQAVYLSRQAFEYTGQWKGMRVEVRPEDVKNRPLSKVLAYTDILKDRVSKLILNTGIPANLPRAANVLVGRGEGRHAVREGIWESEGEEGAIEDIEEEVSSILPYASSY